jgi:uncharacterized membrane protein YjgN (DUF898 family)
MATLQLEQAASPPQGAPICLSWTGNPWSLTRLCFLNVLLIIITIGIYWFWARAEYRKYMWQMVRLQDEPLEYTGTGKELLIGYLRVFLFVFLPLIALTAAAQIVFGPRNPIVAIGGIAVYLAILFLYFAGIFRAHRYILSRTRWRGIAFSLDEGAAGYGWTSLWTVLLSVFTLGWLYPWRTVALRRRLVRAMGFGSAPFRFEGGSGRLYAPFLILWFGFVLFYGSIVTIQIALMKAQVQQPNPAALRLEQFPPAALLLIVAAIPVALIGWSWFEARKLNVFAKATKIGGLDLSLKASAGSMIWLTLSNLLILILSIGILRPVAQARRLRYLVKRMTLTGTADLDAVTKGAEKSGLQGAGLEAAFSIEIF